MKFALRNDPGLQVSCARFRGTDRSRMTHRSARPGESEPRNPSEGLYPHFGGVRIEGDAVRATSGMLQSSRLALRLHGRLRTGIRVRIIDRYPLLWHTDRVAGTPIVSATTGRGIMLELRDRI